jgi:hypothetical protein
VLVLAIRHCVVLKGGGNCEANLRAMRVTGWLNPAWLESALRNLGRKR